MKEDKIIDILIQERFPNHKFDDKYDLSSKQFDYHDMLDFVEHISQIRIKEVGEKVKIMAERHIKLDSLIDYWAEEGFLEESEWSKHGNLQFTNEDIRYILTLTKEIAQK